MSLAPLLARLGSAIMWVLGLLCRCKRKSGQDAPKYPQVTAL